MLLAKTIITYLFKSREHTYIRFISYVFHWEEYTYVHGYIRMYIAMNSLYVPLIHIATHARAPMPMYTHACMYIRQ